MEIFKIDPEGGRLFIFIVIVFTISKNIYYFYKNN